MIYLGKVLIQTYNPDNFSIICSKEQNYERFYKAEINIRKQLKYPPFCDIILINVVSSNEQEMEYAIKFIYNDLVKNLVYKPQPAPIDKIKNSFRWRIILKCKFGNNIIDSINNVLTDFMKYKKRFNSTSVSVDVNPNNMQ